MLSPDTLLQNRYRIVRKLSAGGMGTVYEAIDLRFNSQVALKETHFTEEALRKQFEREAHLLYKLRHPAIARVIDHFTEHEGQFLVMDYVEGEDLWEMLERQHGAFPAEEVLKWADQLLDALEYLHSQEPPIIHRDIKPQNLKLTARNQIILLDFGLAKGFAGQISRVTTSGSIFGYTPNYAPLEQIHGTGTDARSDIYSLAATFYHLLTGKVPPDALSRAMALTNEQPEPLRPANEVNPYVPSEVASVLQKAMAQSANKRYVLAVEMRQALRKASLQQAFTTNREAETKVLPSNVVELPPTVLSPSPVEIQQAQDNQSDRLTEIQRLQLEYWTAFRDYMLGRKSFVLPTKPLPQYWMSFAVGRSGFQLFAYAGMRDKWIGVELTLTDDYAKQYFHLLSQGKAEIEREIGDSLEWREQPEEKYSHISLRQNEADPNNREEWLEQHKWLDDKLETFHRVFSPRIKKLSANDFTLEAKDESLLQEVSPTIASPMVMFTTANSPVMQSSSEKSPLVTTASSKSVTQSEPESNRRVWYVIGGILLFLISVVAILNATRSPSVTNPSGSNTSPTNSSTDKTAQSSTDTKAKGFRVELSSRNESIWIRASVDDGQVVVSLLKPDEIKEFDFAESLVLHVPGSLAKSIVTKINGQPAQLPTQGGTTLDIVITKDNYEQFLLKGSISDKSNSTTTNSQSNDNVANQITEYEDKLSQLKRQRADLLVTYTPEYSEVKTIDAKIADLENKLKILRNKSPQ